MIDNKNVLLVEDDLVDQLRVKRAFRDLKIINPLIIAGNGEDAINYLRDPAAPKPGVILLDMNMPKMNGLEFLEAVKADETLKILPIIILTTSQEEVDILQSFKLSAAGYMVKPVEYGEFLDKIKTIDSYWTMSELP